jgi:uncharacterized lipoprotein YmbA
MNLAASALALLFLAGATACGRSAPSTFYALSPESGAVQPARWHTIRLRRPGVAGYLDRPEIVRRIVDFRLGLVDTDRWASPLDEMLGRVLAEDLQQRLPGSSVFTEDGAISADADATVEVDVRRFDVGDSGEVNLVAEVALEKQGTHAPVGTRAVMLRQTPMAGSTTALVQTMSDLLGKLADQIAALLREGEQVP